MTIPILSISINMDPVIFEVAGFVLTWHGFLTFIAVALAVFLVTRWGKKEGLDVDGIYSISVWAIIGGIIGSRVVHVIDRWNDIYRHDPQRVFEVWEGGIAIYGAIMGGFILAAAYILIRNHPRFISTWNKYIKAAKLERAPLPSVGRMADLAAPALLITMTVGRIGDIINGEHVAKTTEYAWAFIYHHLESPSNATHGLIPSHPAVVYEMIWNMVVLALIWPLRNRLRPYGMLFALYGAAYSVGRFFISFLRTGDPNLGFDQELFIGLNEAQFIAIIVLAITVPLLITKAQLVKPTPITRFQSPRERPG